MWVIILPDNFSLDFWLRGQKRALQVEYLRIEIHGLAILSLNHQPPNRSLEVFKFSLNFCLIKTDIRHEHKTLPIIVRLLRQLFTCHKLTLVLYILCFCLKSVGVYIYSSFGISSDVFNLDVLFWESAASTIYLLCYAHVITCHIHNRANNSSFLIVFETRWWKAWLCQIEIKRKVNQKVCSKGQESKYESPDLYQRTVIQRFVTVLY